MSSTLKTRLEVKMLLHVGLIRRTRQLLYTSVTTSATWNRYKHGILLFKLNRSAIKEVREMGETMNQ